MTKQCRHWVTGDKGSLVNTMTVGPFTCPWCEVEQLRAQCEDLVNQTITLKGEINDLSEELVSRGAVEPEPLQRQPRQTRYCDYDLCPATFDPAHSNNDH